ncbi:MAG TPA: avidin/streptavidin family protein [Albitalea sp.]
MRLEQVLTQWAKSMPAPADTRPPPPDQVAGRWTNDYGSVADLQVDGERLYGTYTSAVGGGAGALSGPVSGFVSGDVVAFSVLWPSHVRSITSWVGQVVEVNGAPELRTLWHLVADIPDADESTGLWATVHSGADTFR